MSRDEVKFIDVCGAYLWAAQCGTLYAFHITPNKRITIAQALHKYEKKTLENPTSKRIQSHEFQP